MGSSQKEPEEDLNRFRRLDPDGNIGPDGGQRRYEEQYMPEILQRRRELQRGVYPRDGLILGGSDDMSIDPDENIDMPIRRHSYPAEERKVPLQEESKVALPNSYEASRLSNLDSDFGPNEE